MNLDALESAFAHIINCCRCNHRASYSLHFTPGLVCHLHLANHCNSKKGVVEIKLYLAVVEVDLVAKGY